MSAILRASGPGFDIDAFIVDCKWDIANMCHNGEAMFPATQPDGRKHEESGLCVVVSDAGFDEFAEQLEDAVEFLMESADEVRRLVGFPGVTGVVLDFGIEWRDVVVQADQFPVELIRLAGACGISLGMSHYPPCDDEDAPLKNMDQRGGWH
jgi:hypothetical protein